jgi:AAA domain
MLNTKVHSDFTYEKIDRTDLSILFDKIDSELNTDYPFGDIDEYLYPDDIFDITQAVRPQRILSGTLKDLWKNDTLDINQWLVKKMFGRYAVSFIFGRTNVGKTFIVTDMIVRMACGVPLFGNPKYKVATPLKIVIVMNEGSNSFSERIRTAIANCGIENALSLCEANICFDFTGILIDNDKNWDAFCKRHEPFAPDFVVIDTLRSATTNGEKEDDIAKEVLFKLQRLGSAMNCHCMLVHHPTKQGAMDDINALSGNGAWASNTDVVLAVEAIDPIPKKWNDPTYFKLSSLKTRDSTMTGNIYGCSHCTIIGVDEDGDDITSRYITWSMEPMTDERTLRTKIIEYLSAHPKTLVSYNKLALECDTDSKKISQVINRDLHVDNKLIAGYRVEKPRELYPNEKEQYQLLYKAEPEIYPINGNIIIYEGNGEF